MIDAKTEIAPGVEFDAGVSGDRYQGKPAALIAAGIITAEHIPANASQTFVDGVKVDGRRVKARHDERWMQVTYIGRALQVTKGISTAERERRIVARRQEAEAIARNTPLQDPGLDAIRVLEYKASAALLVNQEVFVYGQPATVTGAFKLRRVRDEDGQYSDGSGRAEYQPGYSCRLHKSGEEFFYPAHAVRVKAGSQSHLRIVAGGARQREVTFSIRSLA